MTENSGLDSSVVRAGIGRAADANFRMGTLEAADKSGEAELRRHMRSAMLAWLGFLVLGGVPVGLLTGNLGYGFGAALVLMGFYSLITGRAVLKPSYTRYSLFLGWKARGIGVLLLLAAVFLFFHGGFDRP